MSLQESLERFKKQQEKCHSTLSSIANGRNSVPPLPSGVAVKFSNDTERLQHINSIRKAPVGAQMKRVIDLLFEVGLAQCMRVKVCANVAMSPLRVERLFFVLQDLNYRPSRQKTRHAFTPEQINEACYVDMKANKDVFDSLRKNPKVKYDGQRFSYKSKHNLKDKNQLLQLIRKFPEGIAVIDLKDSYPTVMEDLQAWKAAGQIWLLSNFDSQEDIAYPNDPKVPIKVDDDLKQLFRSIELPRDMIDIEKDLQKNGMKPATNTAKRRSAAQIQGASPKPKTKKKKSEISKRTRLTNAHLPELFQNLNSS
ncbi:hypothetical protein TanjilG_28685 [Lupinus angustifolius]|uniref:TFA2 Winged helix domain-containing protein n=1 Tax=Lupinus angustifolius TaxID=3871 RepID=A0A1J7GTV9_LUPAN|nr:hypothetical protein TanjilG_28685 [Lupinus angustifolius]